MEENVQHDLYSLQVFHEMIVLKMLKRIINLVMNLIDMILVLLMQQLYNKYNFFLINKKENYKRKLTVYHHQIVLVFQVNQQIVQVFYLLN